MRHMRKLIVASTLVAAGAIVPALAPTPAAAAASHRAAPALVAIDSVGLIVVGKGSQYTTVLHMKQSGAFIALYHTSYRGALTAHVSVDRDNRPIYRAMMANTAAKTRPFFYVWTRFHNRSQAGHLVAYITIQAGSTKVTKNLPFTLTP